MLCVIASRILFSKFPYDPFFSASFYLDLGRCSPHGRAYIPLSVHACATSRLLDSFPYARTISALYTGSHVYKPSALTRNASLFTLFLSSFTFKSHSTPHQSKKSRHRLAFATAAFALRAANLGPLACRRPTTPSFRQRLRQPSHHPATPTLSPSTSPSS